MASLVTTTINGTLTGNSSATFDSTIRSKNQLRVSNDYSVNYFYNTANDTMLGYLLMRADNNSFLSFPAAQDFRILHGNTSRIAVKTDGNVGIGTTNPTEKLEITGNVRVMPSSGDVKIRLTDQGVRSWDLRVSDGSDYFEIDGTTSTSLVVTGAGNVGIGTISPASKLQIVSSTSGDSVLKVDGTNGTLFEVVDDLSDSLMSVNDAAGLPVFEVFADNHIVAGRYNQNDFYLDTNGNLGLGTSTPSSVLDIYEQSGKDNKLRFHSSTTGSGTSNGSRIGLNGAELFINNIENNAIKIYTQSTQTNGITILGDGKVGIGTVSPSTKLDVAGIIAVRESSNIAFYGGNYIRLFVNANFLIREVGGATRLNFSTTTGDLGLYNSSTVLTNHIDTDGDSFFNGGNVGIGTASPASKLHVHSTTGILHTGDNFYSWVLKYLSNQGSGSAVINYYLIATKTQTNVRFDGVLKGARQVSTSATGSGGARITFYTNNAGTPLATGGLESWATDSYGHPIFKLVELTYNSVEYYAIEISPSTSWSAGFAHVQFEGYANNVLFTNLGTASVSGVAEFSGEESVFSYKYGKLGIGTGSPDAKLHIKAPASSVPAEIRLEHNDGGTQTAKIVFDQSGQNKLVLSTQYQSSSDGNLIQFSPADNIAMTIRGGTGTSDGFVGIGTVSPDAKLEVAGGSTGIMLSNLGDSSAYDGVNMTYSGYNSGTPEFIFQPTTTPGSGTVNSFFRFKNRSSVGSNIANVTVEGKVGIGTGSPDTALHIVGDLTFDGSASRDILFGDNLGAALEFKEGANPYIRIITTNGGEKIEIYKHTYFSVPVNISGQLLIGDGTAGAPGLAFTNDTNTGMWRAGVDNLRLATGGTDAIIIDSSQHVGIGIVPQAKFEVDLNQTNGTLAADNYAHFGGQHMSNGYVMGITLGYREANLLYRKVGIVARGLGDTHARQDLDFLVSTATGSASVTPSDAKLTISGTTGYVGIGKTDPDSPLHVYTTAEATARFQSTDNKAEIYVYDNDTTAILGAENANIYLGSSTGSAAGFLRIATTTGNATFGAVPEGSTRLKIVPRTVEIASNSANYQKAVYVSGLNFYDINSGVTDSGYRIAVDASVFVSDADFEGTLANQYAIWARHGANVSAAGSTITRSIGVYIDSLTNANTTITNLYGLYQEDSVAKNYFSGSVGIGTTTSGSKLHVNGGSKYFGGGDWTTIERVTTTQGNYALYVQTTGTNTNQAIAKFNYGCSAGGANTGTAVAAIAREKSYFLSKLGIGTIVPNNDLVVSDGVQSSYTPDVAGEYIEIARTSGGDAGFLINKNTGQWLFGIDNSDGTNPPLRFEYSAAGSAHAGFGNATLGLALKSDGNVGIGTASPTSKLQIVGSTSGDSALRVDGTSGTIFEVTDDLSGSLMSVNTIAGLPVFEVFADNHIVAGRYNQNDFYLNTNGNLGLGTAVPSYKLDVNAGLSAGGGIAYPIRAGHGSMANAGDGVGILFSRGSAEQYFGYVRIQSTVSNPSFLDPRLEFGIQDTGTYNLADASTRMVITGSGNVGIGTTSPSAKLHVIEADTGEAFRIDGASSGFAMLVEGGTSYKTRMRGGVTIGNGYGGSTPPANGLIVEGSVGIGTASPSQKLHVVGKALITDDLQLTGSNPRIDFNTNGASSLRFYDTNNAAERMRINTSGNLGINTTSPTSKLQVVGSTSGDSVLKVDGTNGTLFEVVDDLSDSLMSVNDAAGLPVFEVFADNHIVAGRYNQNDFYLDTNGYVGIGTGSPSSRLHLVSNVAVGSIFEIDNQAGNQVLRVSQASTLTALSMSDQNGALKCGLTASSTLGGGISLSDTSGGTYLTSFASVGTVFNASGSAVDFRIEGDTDSSLFFVDGSADTVGIGTSSPSYKLHVVGTAHATGNFSVGNGGNGGGATITPGGQTSVYALKVDRSGSSGTSVDIWDNNSNSVVIGATSSEKTLTVKAGGWVGIGATNPAYGLDNNRTSVRTNSYTAEKVFGVSFPNSTANQKVDISFPYFNGTMFWGYLEVTITSSYSNQLSTGKLSKVFAVGLNNPGGTSGNYTAQIYDNTNYYTSVYGAISSQWGIEGINFNTTTGQYYITIAHRVSTGNGIRVSVKAYGYSPDYLASNRFGGITAGSVYTTDATVFDTPVKEVTNLKAHGSVDITSSIGIGSTLATNRVVTIGNTAGPDRPAIKIITPNFSSSTSSTGKAFFRWMPIDIDGTTRWIAIYS